MCKIYIIFIILLFASITSAEEIGTFSFGIGYIPGEATIRAYEYPLNKYKITNPGFSAGLSLPVFKSYFDLNFRVYFAWHSCRTHYKYDVYYLDEESDISNGKINDKGSRIEVENDMYGYFFNSLLIGRQYNILNNSFFIKPQLGIGYMGESIFGIEGSSNVFIDFPIIVYYQMDYVMFGVQINYQRIINNEVDRFSLRDRFNLSFIIAK